MNIHCQEGKEVFLVTHKIFDIDKFCFPSQQGNIFFELSKWTEEMKNIFEAVGKLTEKNNVQLIRGEVREQEGLTYLWIESKTKKDIENFYEGCEKKLISVGHNYDFDTLTIIPNFHLEMQDGINECTTLINQWRKP